MKLEQEEELEHIHRVHYTVMERLAGLFVIIAVALLIGAFAFSREISFMLADKFTLYTEAEDIANLEEGNPITIGGVEVGRVREIEWTDENRLQLRLEILERFHGQVRRDSIARFSPLTLVGEPAVEITRGDPKKPRLKDGDRIRLVIGPTLNDLVSQLGPAVEDITGITASVNALLAAIRPEDVGELTAQLAGVTGNTRELLEKINAGEGSIGRLLADESLAEELARTVGEINNVLTTTNRRLRDAEPLMAALISRIEEASTLMENVDALVVQLTGAVETFGADQGDAVAEVLWETRTALDQAAKTLEAIRNTWPFSTGAAEEPAVAPLPSQPPAN